MEFPLYVTCCFSLTAFNNLSLCLIFVNLISMCLSVFLCMGLYVLLVLDWYFLFYVGKISSYNFFKNFLIPFLFLFFWDFYNSDVGAFNIIPEVSETILSFFFFICSTVFCYSTIISTVLSSSSLIHSSASDSLLLIPSRIFWISVIVLLVSVCLFFVFLLGLC